MMTATQQTAKYLSDLMDQSIMRGATLDGQFKSIEVTGVATDSREVVAGDLFIACSGHTADGREFIEAAVEAGAAAVLAERGESWQHNNIFQGVPVVIVDDLSNRVSDIAGWFYGNPSRSLSLTGVTGTNGKTSCTQILMQLINQFGRHCGVIGTLGVGVDGELVEGLNTTPGAALIQKTLAEWAGRGVEWVTMEVSSHGLEQGRVAGLCFSQAIFTNLTRDHLDYHGDMEAYAAAKSRLFKMQGLKTAIINGDDDFAPLLIGQVSPRAKKYVFSISGKGAQRSFVNVWAEDVRYYGDGIRARIHTPWGEFALNCPLMGSFNLSNVVAAIVAAIDGGLPAEQVFSAAAKLKTVEGRMERIASNTGVTVIVDYAHTPDALEQALLAVRQHTRGKVWCVFGCGGDRDQGKRPQMGSAAQRCADHVVVTSDNPRHEDPSIIINEILGGIDRPTLVDEDRAAAIQFAIEQAAEGDAILVAGKGHEDYQQVGEDRIPFSDIKQVRLALARRENTRGDRQ